MKNPFSIPGISINRQLKEIGTFKETLKMTPPRPRFEIGRGIEGHPILLKQDHHPMPGSFIPEDFGISGVIRTLLAIAVKNRIPRKTSERDSAIRAVGNALYLLMRDSIEGRVYQHKCIFSPSAIVVAVD